MTTLQSLPPATQKVLEGELLRPMNLDHGTSTLLLGPVGTGKTSALRTWVEAGLTVFGLFTEPSYEVVMDIPSDKLHAVYLPPADAPWLDMIDSAKKINQFDLKTLSGMGDVNKGKYTEFIQLLTICSNYKCQRTGEIFGPVDNWGQDRVLWIDSLSGMNVMAMNLVVGSKPVKSIADWGMAMDNLERFIMKLAASLRCHVVLTGHLDPEKDEVTGFTSLMAATLGRKLAPRLPRFFSDVIMTKRTGTKFEWSTTVMGADLKARNLPYADNLPPSFVPLLKTWREREGK